MTEIQLWAVEKGRRTPRALKRAPEASEGSQSAHLARGPRGQRIAMKSGKAWSCGIIREIRVLQGFSRISEKLSSGFRRLGI